MLVLEVGAVVEFDDTESIGMVFKAAQVDTLVELDTAKVGEVELDEAQIDAFEFEETEIGVVELDAAAGGTVELETGELTSLQVVVGPSVVVKVTVSTSQDNMTADKCGDTLWDFSCLPPLKVWQFFTVQENVPFTCFKWTKPFPAKVWGISQTT